MCRSGWQSGRQWSSRGATAAGDGAPRGLQPTSQLHPMPQDTHAPGPHTAIPKHFCALCRIRWTVNAGPIRHTRAHPLSDELRLPSACHTHVAWSLEPQRRARGTSAMPRTALALAGLAALVALLSVAHGARWVLGRGHRPNRCSTIRLAQHGSRVGRGVSRRQSTADLHEHAPSSPTWRAYTAQGCFPTYSDPAAARAAP
jgi:hypothetical protein